MNEIKKIAVLSGGGDSPAINAAIRAIVIKADKSGYEVYGIKNGWDGFIKGQIEPIERGLVSQILDKGGTILGSARVNPFKIENGVESIKANVKKFGIDAMIAIGGDETIGVMHRLNQYNLKGVGIPQTIDNDVPLTDYAIGFDSAVEMATDAIDMLHTTASSHHRIMIVEVMGRYSGWIALYSGIAGGADLILIPEIGFNYDDILNVIEKRRERNKDYSIIVIAEGAKPQESDNDVSFQAKIDKFGHIQLGGIGHILAKEIEKRTGYETRVTILGHLQRGGKPSSYDRLLATRMGTYAVDLIDKGDFDNMVCLQGGKITKEPIEKVLKSEKMIDISLYEMSKIFN
jgi:ATP-dependent phosphofructokinase / diphosphate-dependent phosphofructokinase